VAETAVADAPLPARPARAGRAAAPRLPALPSRPAQILAATQWASAILAAWDLPGRAGAALAGLSELAANATAYGFDGAAGITARLWRNAYDTRWLTVAVHDGNPPPVLRAPAADEQAPEGWGLGAADRDVVRGCPRLVSRHLVRHARQDRLVRPPRPAPPAPLLTPSRSDSAPNFLISSSSASVSCRGTSTVSATWPSWRAAATASSALTLSASWPPR
jgi:hypothetical protein